MLFRNWLIDREGATVSADSEVAVGPASNLLTESRSAFWRSGSLAERAAEATPEVRIDYNLSRKRPVNLVVGTWWNLLVQWAVELYFGNPAAGGELLATSGWVNPIVRSEPDDFSFDEFPWEMGPSDERIESMAADPKLMSFWAFSSTVYGADYVRWRFDASLGANGAFDYLQASLLFAGVAFQPVFNMPLGTTIAPVNRSLKAYTAGGAAEGISRPSGRELTFALAHLSDEEALTQLLVEWEERQGYLARVFAYQEPERRKRRVFYDGGAYVGTLEGFDAVAIEQHEGYMGTHLDAKAVRAIKVARTE